MEKVEVEVGGNRFVVYIREIKWKEYIEIMRKSIEAKMLGNEMVGKMDMATVNDLTIKKSIEKVENKDTGVVMTERARIAEWIDNLPASVGKVINDKVTEVNSFLLG